MLPIAPLEVLCPESIEEAVRALAAPGARLVAGGTDLLPNLKRRLESPARLVSLHRVRGLDDVRVDEDAGVLRLGAGAPLARLAVDPRVAGPFPALAEALAAVASPQIRRRGTLGGNVHLDTRCRYVNQTEFWRGALGGCLKADGDRCHVVPDGRRCVAALSSDTVPVLVALEARLALVGPEGAREVPLEGYFQKDGTRHVGLRPDELCAEVRIPLPTGPRRTAYVKWRPRAAIDFPFVSVAVRLDLGERDEVTAAHVVAGAIAATPKRVRVPAGVLGLRLGDPRLASLLADAAHDQCRPLPNLPYDPTYRRTLIRVLVRRAVAGFRTGDP